MKPFSLVIHFDVGEDASLSLGSSDEWFVVDGLNLEAMVPVFRGGIVVAIAFLGSPQTNGCLAGRFW